MDSYQYSLQIIQNHDYENFGENIQHLKKYDNLTLNEILLKYGMHEVKFVHNYDSTQHTYHQYVNEIENKQTDLNGLIFSNFFLYV